jgi:hypothetical protein
VTMCSGLACREAGAYAATCANYAISAEVIDFGAASMESPTYNMFGILEEYSPQIVTSPGYTLEGRFPGMVYGPGVVVTGETPVITSIHPNRGYTFRPYRVIINGWNISSDAVASLIAPARPTIVGTNITIESSTSMECDFDLTHAFPGRRNVTVTNTGYGKTGTLSDGFTVITPGRVNIIGTPFNEPNPFNPPAGHTMIRYTLNAPATITLYLFNQKGALVWQKTIPAGENGGLAGDNAVPWDAVSDYNEAVPSGVYVLVITSRAEGRTEELKRLKIGVLRQ